MTKIRRNAAAGVLALVLTLLLPPSTAVANVGQTGEATARTASLPRNGRIVFLRGIPHSAAYVASIRSIRANGSGDTLLTKLRRGLWDGPHISPDGTKLAMVVSQHGIVVMNMDGSGRRRLTRTDGDFQTRVRWSPDGKTLAYLNLSANEDYQLYTVPVAGGEPRRISVGLTEVMTRAGYAWSPDSSTLAFGAQDPAAHRDVLFLAAADGSVVDGIPVQDEGVAPCCWWAPADAVDWSPDGSTIAYSYRNAIWTVHPDGSVIKKILSPSPNCESGIIVCDFTEPLWSPTGERLLYIWDQVDDPGGLGVADANGQNDQQIVPCCVVWNASWSPDGTAIVFQGYLDHCCHRADIYTISGAGGVPTQLTFRDVHEGEPDWAPRPKT